VLILLRTAGVPPVSAQFCRDPAVRQTSARSSSIGSGHIFQRLKPNRLRRGTRFPKSVSNQMAHLRVAKRMSGQVRNMSTAVEPNQVSTSEMAPPSSTSSTDRPLSRIAILLFILGECNAITSLGFGPSGLTFCQRLGNRVPRFP
jgi:hypothetical protein